MSTRLLQKVHLGQRGQSSVEFVAILPLLLILLFAMVELGWALKNYLVVTNASREVARCAAVNRCELDGTIVSADEFAEARIRSGAGIHSDDNPLFSIHYQDLDGNGQQNVGDNLVVCIQSPSRQVTPLLAFASMAGALPDKLQLKSRTDMRVEAKEGYNGGDGGDPISSGDSSCSPS